MSNGMERVNIPCLRLGPHPFPLDTLAVVRDCFRERLKMQINLPTGGHLYHPHAIKGQTVLHIGLDFLRRYLRAVHPALVLLQLEAAARVLVQGYEREESGALNMERQKPTYSASPVVNTGHRVLLVVTDHRNPAKQSCTRLEWGRPLPPGNYYLIDIVMSGSRGWWLTSEFLQHVLECLRTASRPRNELVDDDKSLILDIFVRVKPQPQSSLPGRDHRRKLVATILS